MTRVAAAATLVVLTLAGCAAAPRKPAAPLATRIESPSTPRGSPRIPAGPLRKSPYAPAQEDLGKRGNYTRGGLYAPEIQDSAPGGLPDVDLIPEPEVTSEPRSHYGNRSPYEVLGRSYSVVDDPGGYDEVGLASFYGNKFHGRRTSNLEVYDMYAFSAAHKTLPLPSYARVTNLSNGRSVIVRVNDRGPFHEGRIIDLSYAAAVKLGVDRAGTARVEVRGLRPGEDVAARPSSDPVAATASAALPAGVHIATGRPAPATGSGASHPSTIDHLLAALPIASASAAEATPRAPTAPTASASQRFDMRQDGRTMTADEFDAWMRHRQMRVATGKPATSAPPNPAAVAPSAPVVGPSASEIAPRSARSGPAPVRGGRAVTFQVASFAARANAEHALAMLAGAGIDGARLLDADANGRKVWRLRVGPVNPAVATELSARIQGLGFGQPQPVRE